MFWFFYLFASFLCSKLNSPKRVCLFLFLFIVGIPTPGDAAYSDLLNYKFLIKNWCLFFCELVSHFGNLWFSKFLIKFGKLLSCNLFVRVMIQYQRILVPHDNACFFSFLCFTQTKGLAVMGFEMWTLGLGKI